MPTAKDDPKYKLADFLEDFDMLSEDLEVLLDRLDLPTWDVHSLCMAMDMRYEWVTRKSGCFHTSKTWHSWLEIDNGNVLIDLDPIDSQTPFMVYIGDPDSIWKTLYHPQITIFDVANDQRTHHEDVAKTLADFLSFHDTLEKEKDDG